MQAAELSPHLRVRRAARQAPDPQGADRRLRLHHAVELAAEPDRLQGRARRSPPAAPWCSSPPRSRRSTRIIFAEIMHEAGVPKGVFNLVNGDGPGVGAALVGSPRCRHGVLHRLDPRRRAGRAGGCADRSSAWRRNSAASPPTSCSTTPTCTKAVKSGVMQMMTNSGQSCNAPTRMFVPRAKNDEAKAIAKATAEAVKVQDPEDRRERRHRPRRLRSPVQQDPGPDQEGHR